MAITLQSIVNDTRILLNDVGGVRWTDAEFLVWGNAGRRDMCAVNPSLWGTLAKRRVPLAAGAYQTLPALGVADAFALVDVINNVSAGAAGDVIRKVGREQLDNFIPAWRGATSTTVQNWVRDEAYHLAFWVYPSVPGGEVDINVSVTPSNLNALTEVAVPMDVMATTLMHYLLYRAYAKDAEVAQSATLSAQYFQLFTAAAIPSA